MKALLQFSASERLKARLASLSGLYVTVVEERDELGFRRAIGDTDVLLHVLEPVTATMIAMAPNLKLIQKIGVGVNTIDLDAAREAGVQVANLPGTNTAAVAEHTLSLMLATLRRVTAFDQATRKGAGWQIPPDQAEALGEINRSRIGLIGFGAVAERLASYLNAMGAKVQYWSRSLRPNADAAAVSFDELLETSDIISLHIPATPETVGLLDAAALQRMKPGAILINTARGNLVDEAALAVALKSGHIGGAGLDVFEDEPMRGQSDLVVCPNVVMTPHIAWLTPETLDRSLRVIEQNCQRIAEGRDVLHRIW
ncbi:2-hydroxyacid dehydrogenase [Sneathiella chinensis]|uniref:Glyoxylate reductase n=1 Tax=Sneathiella chinensis TaxID=349750 RepID=A0ABQ5U640_9PROT|nr:2-hydroxyacid dehydrogenase [Sneathiella chinensis]GLQ06846.1 glyoxylate reductase [Sneathiella chinensis]